MVSNTAFSDAAAGVRNCAMSQIQHDNLFHGAKLLHSIVQYIAAQCNISMSFVM